MKHTYGKGVLVLALLACLSACADSVSTTVGPTISRDDRTDPAPSSSSAERAALTKVARLVAVAMDNEPARQHLKRDLKAAPFREHKLELGTYLRSKDGGALLERIVALDTAPNAICSRCSPRSGRSSSTCRWRSTANPGLAALMCSSSLS